MVISIKQLYCMSLMRLQKLFALKYFQSGSGQAAKFGKASLVNSGEVEAGLALHALLQGRRHALGSSGLLYIQAADGSSRSSFRSACRQSKEACRDGKWQEFPVVVSRLVCLYGQNFAEEALE